MFLSSDQIFRLARNAGFPLQVAIQMVAIALRESAGDPMAHLVGPVDDSYGLWQINMLGSLGPARRKQFGLSANFLLLDPATNARAAFLTWGGSKRNLDIAWAIDRGIWKVRYQAHMGTAIAAAIAAGESAKDVTAAVISLADPGPTMVASMASASSDWLRDLLDENPSTKPVWKQLYNAA